MGGGNLEELLGFGWFDVINMSLLCAFIIRFANDFRRISMGYPNSLPFGFTAGFGAVMLTFPFFVPEVFREMGISGDRFFFQAAITSVYFLFFCTYLVLPLIVYSLGSEDEEVVERKKVEERNKASKIKNLLEVIKKEITSVPFEIKGNSDEMLSSYYGLIESTIEKKDWATLSHIYAITKEGYSELVCSWEIRGFKEKLETAKEEERKRKEESLQIQIS